MKNFKYIELPAISPKETNKEGSLIDLLESIPYLLHKKRLPPKEVLNSIFLKGIADAGMSGGLKWEPFEIDSEQYDELANIYRLKGFKITEPPIWVQNETDFQAWVFEMDHGVPAEKHKLLADLEDEARTKLDAAINDHKSEEEITELHLKAINAGNALTEYLDDYL